MKSIKLSNYDIHFVASHYVRIMLHNKVENCVIVFVEEALGDHLHSVDTLLETILRR